VESTVAIGRVWLFAFWRGGPEGTADGTAVPAIGRDAGLGGGVLVVPVIALTALAVLIGVAPAGLFDLAGEAAATLLDPHDYIAHVFPGGAP
jgi:multicomponent Na+:H+ antiporter subunit D